MKILFYINAIHHGGAERVICNLATQFSEHGHECVLITSFRDDWEYSVNENVRRITLFEHQLKQGFLRRNSSLVKSLRKVLNEEKPDILISFMAEPNYRAIVASAGLKHKVVISIRNDPNREYPNILNRFLAKTLFRLADGIVFQTDNAQKWFPKSIQNKSKIIYNQVDKIFYRTVYGGVRHDVVTTGRLTAQKNHKMLIRAFAQIADHVTDKLFIYGEGELRGELESLIAELHMQNRIFLPGSTKNVAETIKSAKLFVLSSDYEGMPNSLLEAMALGLPCLSTDCPCGGPQMLLKDYSDYCLSQVNDFESFSKKMCVLLRDAALLASIGNELRRRSLGFNPSEVYKEWASYVISLNEMIK